MKKTNRRKTMDFVADLKKGLIQEMKNKDTKKRDHFRSIIAEFERQLKKEFSEDEVSKIIKSMIKLEKEKMDALGETTSEFLTFLETFMPEQVSEDDIKNWIDLNIDFGQYKNKMQAMGPIMKYFGNTADGNAVRNVLSKI